ncbi:MAG: 30S ribosomal protein S17 [Armatimonadetes bacterium]|nr:30S ribosomal protein S17 [Armatimonadota bacterium]
MAERGRRKNQVGVVTSDKMTKTVVVRIETITHHPLYKKAVRRSRSVKAHDEQNQARAGDRVRIVETRPVSQEKRWRVVEILKRAE